MQANIFKHMRGGDNCAREVCQWIRYRKGDRSTASAVKDRRRILRILLERLQGDIRLVPRAQTPQFPFMLLPVPVANSYDLTACLGNTTRHVATKKAVCARHQKMPRIIQIVIDR